MLGLPYTQISCSLQSKGQGPMQKTSEFFSHHREWDKAAEKAFHKTGNLRASQSNS